MKPLRRWIVAGFVVASIVGAITASVIAISRDHPARPLPTAGIDERSLNP